MELELLQIEDRGSRFYQIQKVAEKIIMFSEGLANSAIFKQRCVQYQRYIQQLISRKQTDNAI